jgi:hypothetical protein
MYLGNNSYWDGTNWLYSVTPARATSQYRQVLGEHSWHTAASGTAGNAITFTQAMTLDASGNLGIGTTSPSARLDVTVAGTASYSSSSAPTPNIFLGTTGAANSRYTSIGINCRGTSGQSQTNYITSVPEAADGNAALAFSVYGGYAAVERARITSDGDLLVGKTDVTVTTNGVTIGAANYVASSRNNDPTGFFTRSGTDGSAVVFYKNTTDVGSISVTTTATAYNTSSDQRLKQNIQDADPASALIDSLQVRKFDWKSDGSHQRYGFVAQELVTVAPEAVHQPTDSEEMMAVDYSKLVPMLVKEIQSLRKRLADAGI